MVLSLPVTSTNWILEMSKTFERRGATVQL